MEERQVLLRVAVLSRLLAEALDELHTALSTAQFHQELAALKVRAEAKLSESS